MMTEMRGQFDWTKSLSDKVKEKSKQPQGAGLNSMQSRGPCGLLPGDRLLETRARPQLCESEVERERNMRYAAQEVEGLYTLRGCFRDEGLKETEELDMSSRRTWGGRMHSWFLRLSLPALFLTAATLY